ncbi:MAG: ribonuclease H-like domain-containing protein [Desulfobacteraceae bacterium]|nr:ribonuclease H-like domain-containing protein [Desulfobacteraceae bacterium]
MLQDTFCHISGVGPKTEARLWEAGICTWPDFAAARYRPVSRTKASLIRAELEDSQIAFENRNSFYFSKRLSADQQWRLFPEFRNTAAYLDIETTGLSSDYNRITTIALYDGNHIRYYVNGRNLEKFVDDIACYDLLITYNGKTFDLPFIERFFGIRLQQAHVDLRYLLKSLGYKGGLKGCERSLGLQRNELEGVDGYFAVLLWHEYERKADPRVLQTLLAYNIEDVVNLEYLMHVSYNLKLAHTPFSEHMRLSVPPRPSLPFAPDREVLERIRGKYGLNPSASRETVLS